MSASDDTPTRVDPLTWLLLQPIAFYRRFVSPALPPSCRYAPTCSAYAVEALRVHGPFKGLVLAVWRVLRCNPWSSGGVDHVPARGRWRSDAWIPPEDWAGNDPTIEAPLPMGMVDTTRDAPLPSPEAAQWAADHSEDAPALVDDHPVSTGRTAGATGVPTT